jgi:predicted DNA-binding transcriptional regulator AlpA
LAASSNSEPGMSDVGDRGGELMSGKEIAELLGWVNPATAWQQFRKGTFPQPVRMERPRMWLRADVEEWARTSRRFPQRRRLSGDL